MWRGLAGLIFLLAMLWPAGAADAGQVYVVRQGDTLWRISHRLGIRPADLAAANHLSLSTIIHPGLRLIIPGPSTAATRSSAPSPRSDARLTPRPSAGRPPRPRESITPSTGPAPRPSAPLTPRPDAPLLQPAPEHRSSPAGAPEPAQAAVPQRSAGGPSGIVRIATGYLGRPYQPSGTGSNGFDCSGLVSRVYAEAGRTLPRTSYGQYQTGTPVTRGALEPGDLVFFQTTDPGPSHVGIYVGSSQFIHASYSRGVVMSSIDEPYFRDRYLGARRIPPG